MKLDFPLMLDSQRFKRHFLLQNAFLYKKIHSTYNPNSIHINTH